MKRFMYVTSRFVVVGIAVSILILGSLATAQAVCQGNPESFTCTRGPANICSPATVVPCIALAPGDTLVGDCPNFGARGRRPNVDTMSSTVLPAAFAFLFGLSKNDVICASGNPLNNTGQTVIEGGAGSDVITGFPFTITIGPMFVQGGPGRDTILGSLLNDDLNGGPGNDVINGNTGNDNLTGGNGDDIITGGLNVDFVSAGDGNDVIFVGGDLGADSVNCGAGADSVGLVGPPGSFDPGLDVLDPTTCFP